MQVLRAFTMRAGQQLKLIHSSQDTHTHTQQYLLNLHKGKQMYSEVPLRYKQTATQKTPGKVLMAGTITLNLDITQP